MAVQSVEDPMLNDRYVRHWFIDHATLVRRSGGTADQIDGLLAHRAAPGAIYIARADGTWWSALDARTDGLSSAGHRYSPAALYWLRHGLLRLRGGQTFAAAAEANRAHFGAQFAAALSAEPLAAAAFGAAFAHGDFDGTIAAQLADREWADWIRGGYAVCLRSFTGASCVQKEAIGAVLKRQRNGAASGTELDEVTLLDLIERLDSLMLPFAPRQRAACTPGLAIDRLLSVLDLGVVEPYADLAVD